MDYEIQLVEDSMVKLDRICRNANVMLIFARSYGLTGFVRVSVKVCVNSIFNTSFFVLHFFYLYRYALSQEHTVIESKPDHFLDDLRLNNPWPELKKLVLFIINIFLYYFSDIDFLH